MTREKWEKLNVNTDRERIVRRGGNQYGQYVILCSVKSRGVNVYWRTWINATHDQVFLRYEDRGPEFQYS